MALQIFAPCKERLNTNKEQSVVPVKPYEEMHWAVCKATYIQNEE